VTNGGLVDLHPQIINMVFILFLPLLALDCETWLHKKMKIVCQAIKSKSGKTKAPTLVFFATQNEMLIITKST
jgi:hypothetical protein